MKENEGKTKTRYIPLQKKRHTWGHVCLYQTGKISKLNCLLLAEFNKTILFNTIDTPACELYEFDIYN